MDSRETRAASGVHAVTGPAKAKVVVDATRYECAIAAWNEVGVNALATVDLPVVITCLLKLAWAVKRRAVQLTTP